MSSSKAAPGLEDPVSCNLDTSMRSFERTSNEVEKQVVDDAAFQIEIDHEPRDVHGLKWAVIVIAILSSMFLFALDNTVVADIQPEIILRFGSVERLPWVGTSFALGAIAILPWGKAYGVFNIKWLYIINVILFEVGSAICGASPNLSALIVGRAIAGIGGSGLYSGCLTYLSVTTTERERPTYISFVGIVWGVGTVLGPIVGGAFAQSEATWRWAFYINLAVGAIFAPVLIFGLPSINLQKQTSFVGKLKQMDWLGIVLFNAAMACFIMGINFGGSIFAWRSASEIVLWVMAGVLFIGFFFAMRFHPFVSRADRLYPVHFLQNPILLNLQSLLFLASGVLQVSDSFNSMYIY